MRSLGLFLLLAGLGACSRESELAARPKTDAEKSCIECHAEINPGLVADHEASPHNKVPLRCEECHGTDHEQMFSINGAVPPTVCARCHEEAYESFRRSRHGIRLKGGKLDALLLAAPLATGGCTATGGCHSIQQTYADESVGRCGSCHTTHAFSNKEARNPRVCIGCHGGSDHPQYEAWLRSAHSLPSPSKEGPVADCVECHGTHDVSAGIVHGLPPTPDSRPLSSVPAAPREEFVAARATMTKRCLKCHVQRRADAALAKADFWRYRGAAVLDEAARIVTRLGADGLIEPHPADRTANPVAGHALRLGGAQIFDLTASLPERIYYTMHFRHYPALWRSAYHTDPERTTWEFNDDMKAALDELRTLDRELRRAERTRNPRTE